MVKILAKYTLKDLVLLFTITLLFFSFIFLMTQLLEITNYIVNYAVGLGRVMLLLAYNMPFFLQFIIPMAVMIAVLLVFLRMSADNEVIALKASGVSIVRLLPPVLVFGLTGSLLTAFMGIYALPHGRLATRQLVYEMARNHLDIGLKQRQFLHHFKDILLYVNEVDTATKSLKDVFIEDRRTPNVRTTVLAPRGRMVILPEQALVLLKLADGTIHQVDVLQGTATAIQFESYDIRLDTARSPRSVGGGPKDEEEMNLSELYHAIRSDTDKDAQYYITLMEWHKKFSLPASCVLLAFLGVPLGIQVRSTKKTFGIGLGLGYFLAYYLMLSAGWVFGEAGVYPPLVGMWVPNLVTLVLGLFLFYRCVHEKPLPWPSLRHSRLAAAFRQACRSRACERRTG